MKRQKILLGCGCIAAVFGVLVMIDGWLLAGETGKSYADAEDSPLIAALEQDTEEELQNEQNEKSGENTREEFQSIVGRMKKEMIEAQKAMGELKKPSETVYPPGWKSTFIEKLRKLRQLFPDGAYWNHMGTAEEWGGAAAKNWHRTTDTPCSHSEYGEEYCNEYNGKSSTAYPYTDSSTQCWGFASLLSDMVFGKDAPVTVFYDYDSIRLGDQARIYNESHTVFIIRKTSEYIEVAECNADYETCMIHWGRKIYREELQDAWYITRWE